jgi:hypothetical protein
VVPAYRPFGDVRAQQKNRHYGGLNEDVFLESFCFRSRASRWHSFRVSRPD